MDPTRLGPDLIKTQSPDQELEISKHLRSIESFEEEHGTFIEKNKGNIAQWDVRLLIAIYQGISARDFAEEHGREADEIELEMANVKKKWLLLGGPDL